MLLKRRVPAAKAMSSIAAMPTSCNSRFLACSGGSSENGNFARASKTWPITLVMNGAIPPATIETKIAGRRKVKTSRLVR